MESAAAVLATGKCEMRGGARLQLLRTLLREARHNRNEGRFRQVDAVLAAEAPPGSDAHAELIAQRLLWARDGLDYAAVSSGAPALAGPDPMWLFLRAALHCECGETELAKPLIAKARADLAGRQRMDARSVSVASRRAWGDLFGGALRMSETWIWKRDAPGSTLTAGYDAEDEIDQIRGEVRSARMRRMEEPQGYQPRFGPGAYQDHSRTVRFCSAAFGSEAETVFRLADAACLPLRIDNVDVLASLARDALENEPLPTLGWHLRLLRAISSHSSPMLERHFDSVSIARLDPGMASELIRRMFAAARFWQPRAHPGTRFHSTSAVERLRVIIEVLSRLIVRAEPSVALEAFRLGCDIVSDPLKVHHWLYEPIGNLLKWSLISLPPAQRGRLVIDCLEFPLPPGGQPAQFRWPEPAGELFSHKTPPDRPSGEARWRACVARLLAAVAGAGHTRTQAVHRLTYLAAYGCLEDREREEFGRLLWSFRDPKRSGLPLDVDLFPHVVAALPGTDDIDPEGAARSYLFETAPAPGDAEGRLQCIAVAARSREPFASMLPRRKQAAELLDGIAALIESLPADGDPISMQARKHLVALAGSALGHAILPQLEAADLTSARLAFVDLCAGLGSGGGALSGLHELARISPDLIPRASADLRRAIARGDLRDVEGAARSIWNWAEAARNGRCPPLPEPLKDAVIAALEVGVRHGLQPRLWCARHLLQANALSASQIEALLAVLADFREDLAYNQMPQEGPAAIGITIARAECVRLAGALVAAGYPAAGWTDDMEADPLPEVRFAQFNSD